MLDSEACYRAVLARDLRFDGRFFTCVTSTGVYCRPVCPARTPRFENCRFVPSAAAAQELGFRPCLRCRPELSPHLAAFRGTEATVERALSLIADGALDGEAGVDALAERLGLGERQLRRLFERHLGASPVSVAQTRRVLFALQLVRETRLSMAEVALAAGFGSIRRYNAVFRALYRRSPASLRRATRTAPKTSSVTLKLAYRPPYDWDAMLAHFAARAIAGVELVEHDRYARTVELDGALGSIEVRPGGRGVLLATLRIPAVKALPALVSRIRRAFDLDADVETIAAHLGQDPRLSPLVKERPGLRTPGGWDPFEQAVRAILGQQVTVTAARKLASRLVSLAGLEVEPEQSGDSALNRLFPGPTALLATGLATLGMPRARRAAIVSLCGAASDPALFDRHVALETAVLRLQRLAGFGPWTAEYVALRALGHSDAFPAGDVALQRSATPGSLRLSETSLRARAEAWRPWRAYAAQHLWTADAARKEAHAQR
jgi:AraC family transcriptional regulator, regulatory protein of adaptative response / DNA-3-methyladenine glycosylase II